FEGWLTWMHTVLEIIKILPLRLGCLMPRLRCIERRFDQSHGRNVARAVRKNCLRRNAHDQLRADGLAEQSIVLTHGGDAIDAQTSPLPMHGDEQNADMRIDQDIAKTLAVSRLLATDPFGGHAGQR